MPACRWRRRRHAPVFARVHQPAHASRPRPLRRRRRCSTRSAAPSATPAACRARSSSRRGRWRGACGGGFAAAASWTSPAGTACSRRCCCCSTTRRRRRSSWTPPFRRRRPRCTRRSSRRWPRLRDRVDVRGRRSREPCRSPPATWSCRATRAASSPIACSTLAVARARPRGRAAVLSRRARGGRVAGARLDGSGAGPRRRAGAPARGAALPRLDADHPARHHAEEPPAAGRAARLAARGETPAAFAGVLPLAALFLLNTVSCRACYGRPRVTP